RAPCTPTLRPARRIRLVPHCPIKRASQTAPAGPTQNQEFARQRVAAKLIRGVTRVDLRYEAPETLQAAVALRAGAPGPATILAAATDVIVQTDTGLIDPSLLVDIQTIPELRQTASERRGFRIGAAVPGMATMGHQALAKAWPGVLDGV